jgi:flagellar FliL protein
MRFKWLIILVVLLLLFGGGGIAAYLVFGTRIVAAVDVLLGKKPPATAVAAAVVPTGPPAVPIPNSYYKLPQIMGTVIDTDYTPHMLQARVSIYLHDPSDLLWVQAFLPRITDAFQVYIRDEIVVDRAHPVDIDRMRQVMLGRINAVIAPAKIDDINVLSLVIE